MVYYRDESSTIYCADVFDGLAALEDKSVQCVVTSPPYWGLRDYGTASWEGGDAGCEHSTPRSRGDDILPDVKQATSAGSRPNTQKHCRCGARRIDSQIGLEATLEEYVGKMVAVFAEVRRVLRSDGTFWLNLGDVFAQNGGWADNSGLDGLGRGKSGRAKTYNNKSPASLKPKDLCGIPWRVALALQADGWWLRSDIIWAKPNPMPESVTDRPTKSHEYLFLLAKSARYFYDADAIKEPAVYAGDCRGERTDNRRGTECNSVSGTTGSHRNKRDVWTIATQQFSGAHFAVFPEALVEPCVMAGSAVGDTVLDPFMGAGTVLKVAEKLNRKAIGIELSADYCAMAKQRLAQGVLDLRM